MPVKKCVRIGSKLYCFNRAENNVSVYREQIYKINECPESVIAAFINEEYDAEIVVDRVAEPLTNEEINFLLEKFSKNGKNKTH